MSQNDSVESWHQMRFQRANRPEPRKAAIAALRQPDGGFAKILLRVGYPGEAVNNDAKVSWGDPWAVNDNHCVNGVNCCSLPAFWNNGAKTEGGVKNGSVDKVVATVGCAVARSCGDGESVSNPSR